MAPYVNKVLIKEVYIYIIYILTILLFPISGAAQQEVNNDTVKAEIELLADALSQPGTDSADRIFIAALILQKQERHGEAVLVLRRLVNANPSNLIYRQALVVSLLAEETYENAEFQLEQLRRLDPDVVRRENYRRIENKIWETKPSGWSLTFALVPSSNVNRATSNTDAPDIGGLEGQIDVQGEPGISFDGTLSGYRRFSAPPNFHIEASGYLRGQKFSDSQYDWGTASGSISVRQDTKSGYWEIEPSVAKHFYTEREDDSVVFGIGFHANRQTQNKFTLDFYANLFSQSYEAERNQFLEGRTGSATAEVLYRLSGSTSIGGSFSLRRSDLRSAVFSNFGQTVRLNAAHLWQNGVTVRVFGQFESRLYDTTFSGFIPERRKDRKVIAGFSLLNANFVVMNSTPVLSCSRSVSKSNIVFFDNLNVSECRLAFTRRF